MRRPVGPWSPAIHALLEHLNAAGVVGVPRVHGHDVRGREILDFLPGEVLQDDPTPISIGPPHGDRAVDLWLPLRLVAGFQHDGPWRFLVADEPTLVGHNDIAPYNIAFDDERVVGVFRPGHGRAVDSAAGACPCGLELHSDVE